MRKIIYYLCIACIVFLFIALLRQFYGVDRATEKSAGGNGTVTEITRATELNQQARTENKSAQHSIEQAEGRVEQAEQSNEATQAGLDKCAKILDEIRNDNSSAKQIVDGIIRNAQSGTEEN